MCSLFFSGKGIVFQCKHKYHSSCLSNSGCLRQVFDKGQDLWLCYTCLSLQPSTAEDENQIVKVEEFDNDELPSELINDITNQQVVKAHNYIKKLKRANTWQTGDHTSIFDTDGFKLNLYQALWAAGVTRRSPSHPLAHKVGPRPGSVPWLASLC